VEAVEVRIVGKPVEMGDEELEKVKERVGKMLRCTEDEEVVFVQDVGKTEKTKNGNNGWGRGSEAEKSSC
jgi:hypothetical protein